MPLYRSTDRHAHRSQRQSQSGETVALYEPLPVGDQIGANDNSTCLDRSWNGPEPQVGESRFSTDTLIRIVKSRQHPGSDHEAQIVVR